MKSFSINPYSTAPGSIDQTEELEKLRTEIKELTEKLHITDELKMTLENQLQSHRETISELQKDLDMKCSGAKASEMCLKDEMNYLETRVNDLERELGEKTNAFDLQQAELMKLEELKKEEVAKLEKQLQDKNVALSSSESSLTAQATSKDNEIEKLRKDIESLTSSDAGTQDIIKGKDNEIQQLMEQTASQDKRLKELDHLLETKAESFATMEQEKIKLHEASNSLTLEYEENCKKQGEELQKKVLANHHQEKKIEVLLSEVSVLKMEVERYRGSSNDTDLSLQKSLELEENLKRRICELDESQVKLKTDVDTKDSQLKNVNEKVESLQKEIDERNKCIAGLEVEVQSITKNIAEKETSNDQLKKDFSTLEARTQQSLHELEGVKQTASEELLSVQKSFDETAEKLKTDHEIEKTNLISKIDELTKAIKDKDSQLDKIEKNTELLTEVKASLDQELKTKENDIQELTTKLNKTERDNADQVSV